MAFVYVVIDDLPQDFGEIAICSIYDNPKAALTEVTALRQIDAFKNQYVTMKRYKVLSTSEHKPVSKR